MGAAPTHLRESAPFYAYFDEQIVHVRHQVKMVRTKLCLALPITKPWVMGAGARGLIVAEYRVTGLSPSVIAELIAEVGSLWHERHQARLTARPRQRAVGVGAKHKCVFVLRALARHLGRREHMSDIVQAVAGLLSHQQIATLSRGLQA